MKSASFSAVRSAISVHRLAFTNVLLFLSCLIFGYLNYSGAIAGEGDDLAYVTLALHTSAIEYVKYIYNNYGLLGGLVAAFPWHIFVNTFQFDPISFPWWLPAAINLFCLIALPLNMVVALRRLGVGQGVMFVSIILVLAWTVNPLTYQITLDGRPANLGQYWIPAYLISIFVAIYSKYNTTTISRMVIMGMLYIPVALHNSLYAGSLAGLVLSISIVKSLEDKRWFWHIRHAVIFLLISFVCAAITWGAPGFAKYRASVGFAAHSWTDIWNVVVPRAGEVINNLYNYLTAITFDKFIEIHLFILLTLLIGGVGYLLAFLRRKVFLVDKASLYWLLSVGWLFSFHVSISSILFVEMFPVYHQFFPALLLAIGISLWLLWWFELLAERLSVFNKKNRILNDISTGVIAKKIFVYRAMTVILAMSFVFPLLLHRGEKVANVFLEEIWLGNAIRDLRKDILDSHIHTGQKQFYVTHCPARTTYWVSGENRFFDWLGYKDVHITKYDGVKVNGAPLGHTEVICNPPTLWQFGHERDTFSVRVLTDNPPYSFFLDYAVQKNAAACKLNGEYTFSLGGTATKIVRFEHTISFDNDGGVKFSATGGNLITDAQLQLEVTGLDDFSVPEIDDAFKLIRIKIHTLYPSDWWKPFPDVKLVCK